MQLDKCYDHTELHILSYIINWSSVVINPIIYVVSQKKYQDALKYTKNAIKGVCRRGSEEDRGQKMSVSFGVWILKSALFNIKQVILQRTSLGSDCIVVRVTPSFGISEGGAHPLL